MLEMDTKLSDGQDIPQVLTKSHIEDLHVFQVHQYVGRSANNYRQQL